MIDVFTNRLKTLNEECEKDFERFGSSDSEYKQIRVDVLELLQQAQVELLYSELEGFKRSVINFLCANCGCHLDLIVLQKYVPHVLALEELEHIKNNSALGRWY
jgi:hypothetical protein